MDTSRESLNPGLPLTKDQQSQLSPQAVLDDLLAGNDRYLSGEVIHRDNKASIKQSASGQFPKAAILSCLDSRVIPEIVFDQGIGDLFVGRVAGNVENDDMIGSLEFATEVSGSKIVLVLGHTECGAVKAACNHVELGNLTPLLNKIGESVNRVAEKTGSSGDAIVNDVVEENVRRTITAIRKQSQMMKALEDKGELMIVGAVYDLQTGRVRICER